MSRPALPRILIAAAVLLVVVTGRSLSFASDVVNFEVVYRHDGEDKPVQASAWVPGDVPVRAMLYLCPGTTGSTRTHVSNTLYQAFAQAMDFAMVGMEDRDILEGFHGANAAEITTNVQHMLDTAGSILGSPQLSNAPIAFYGFSKGGGTVNLLASLMPERTICFMTDKSSSFVTNDWEVPARVPGLFVGGTEDHISGSNVVYAGFDFWRVTATGEVALAVDWQSETNTHQPTSLKLIRAFIAQCTARRYPAGAWPSAEPGSPLTLTTVDPEDGWLVETSYSNGYARILSPVAAPATDYADTGKPPETAGWIPGRPMAMILRAHNDADPEGPDGRGNSPIRVTSTTPPRGAVSLLTYALGQTVDVRVTNLTLVSEDISRVRIYHEDHLIGEFPSLGPGGVSASCRLTEPGVHTLWADVTYTHGGEDTSAVGYWLALVVRGRGGTVICVKGASD